MATAHMILGRRLEPAAFSGCPSGIRRVWRIAERGLRMHDLRVKTTEPKQPDYESVAQLAERVRPWTEHAIRRMVSRGILRRGVHYHQPGGRRGKLMFDVDAIDEFIRRGPERAPEPRQNQLMIMMADGTEVRLDDEEDDA